MPNGNNGIQGQRRSIPREEYSSYQPENLVDENPSDGTGDGGDYEVPSFLRNRNY